MRILIATDINIGFTCGSANFFRRMGAVLRERGHEFVVVCPAEKNKTGLHKYEEVDVYGVSSIPSVLQKTLRVSNPFFLRRDLKRVVEEFRPDIIHTQTHWLLPPTLIGIARRRGIPIMATNHFVPENVYYAFHVPGWLEPLVRWVSWKQLHLVLNKVDFVTVPTETAARLLRESGYKRQVKAISNGINLKKFEKKVDGLYLFEKYKIPNKKVILFVGRLDPEKRVDVFLKSLPEIFEKDNESCAVVVGTGLGIKSLRKLAKKLRIEEKVIFAGFVSSEDLYAFYRISEVYVMTGVAELQSISTLEAMASDLPVVGADAMALPELVHDRENGYLFPANDYKSLSKVTLKILENDKLRKKMAKESLRIVKLHDINRTADTFEDLYKNLIEKKKK